MYIIVRTFINFYKIIIRQEGLKKLAYKILLDNKKQLKKDRKLIIPKITSVFPDIFEFSSYLELRPIKISRLLAYVFMQVDRKLVILELLKVYIL